MGRLARWLAVTAAAGFGALALLTGVVFVQRAMLTYNEEGRHFDEAQSVVYDEGAIAVYGGLCLLFALLAAAASWAAMRRTRGD